MALRSITLTGTTDGSGALTVNADLPVKGFLEAVEWVFGSGTSGVDAVISEQSPESGVAHTLLTLTDANANAVYYPRYVVHSEAGAALTGTSGGDRTKYLLSGKLRMVVAQGGSAKPYTVVIWYEKKD